MGYSLSTDTGSRHVAIIGSGRLGRRIGLVWASKGGSVIIVNRKPEAVSAALVWIKTTLPTQAKAVQGAEGQITGETNIANAVKGAWMVVECISEIKEAKVELLRPLDEFCDKDAIIATVSSSFKSGDLLDNVSNEGRIRVLNTHYLQPPEVPGVEIMSSGYTDLAIIDTLVYKLKEIGLDPAVAKKQSTGLIYNRIWAAMKREVMMVLADEVGTPEEIDKLFRYSFSSQQAPCNMMDDVGLQTVCNIEDHYIKERGCLPRYPVDYIRRNYVDRGNLGTATSRGLFDYKNHSEKTLSGERRPSLRSQLIGAWELVKYSASKEQDQNNNVYPMGEDAQGIVIYTPDGYMSAQIQKPGQPKFQFDDLNAGTEEEIRAVGEHYLAYTGPFYLDESGEVPILYHHMTNCTFPNWLGKSQRRTVVLSEEGAEKYITLGPESAVMIMGEMRVPQLKWRRLPNNQALHPAS
ncbi:MAG: hypothetical protein LQ351_001902 [Letrouitia transgressa]|nr:MAG: hypothetical protein LQ351_001902 [Letrouitia transgressa]